MGASASAAACGSSEASRSAATAVRISALVARLAQFGQRLLGASGLAQPHQRLQHP